MKNLHEILFNLGKWVRSLVGQICQFFTIVAILFRGEKLSFILVKGHLGTFCVKLIRNWASG